MEKKKRNHARSSDKIQLSIALTKSLLSDVESIASHEDRNRNKMINLLLQEACTARIATIIEQKKSSEGGDQKSKNLLVARTKLSKQDPLYLSEAQVEELLQ
jgi:hypothetical protein